MEQAVVVRVVRPDLAEPADGRAVEADLVDRLPGADTAQLRRPVAGEHDQRDRGLIGLADGGVEVGGGRPRRAGDRDRLAGGVRGSESQERRRALVDDARRDDPALPQQGQGDRGRARAGTDHRPLDPRARELFDQRRCECGVAVGRVHRALNLPRDPVALERAPRRSRRRGPGRPGGGVGRRAARTRGSRRLGEQALRRQAMSDSRVEAALAQNLGRVRRGGDARPVRRARSTDRWGGPPRSGAPRRSRQPWRASPWRTRRPGAGRARCASASSFTDSSAARGIATSPATRAIQRRPATGCSASSMPCGSSAWRIAIASSGSQAPFASTRISRPGPTASRTAATAGHVVPGAELELERPEALGGPALRPVRRGRPGSAAVNVALRLDRLRLARPERRPERLVGLLRGEVEQRALERRGGRRRQLPRPDELQEGRHRNVPAAPPRQGSRSSADQPLGSLAQRRSTSAGPVLRAATAAPPRRAPRAARRCAGEAGPSRAARAPRER